MLCDGVFSDLPPGNCRDSFQKQSMHRNATNLHRFDIKAKVGSRKAAIIANDHVEKFNTVSFARDSIRITVEIILATLASKRRTPHRTPTTARNMPRHIAPNSQFALTFARANVAMMRRSRAECRLTSETAHTKKHQRRMRSSPLRSRTFVPTKWRCRTGDRAS
jgi:hypothetical protein